MKLKNGVSVIVKNEREFNSMKIYLGEKNLYIEWVPQMSELETAVIVKGNKKKGFSVGSVGSSEYQRNEGIKLISFEEYITM